MHKKMANLVVYKQDLSVDLPVAAVQEIIQVSDQTGKRRNAYTNPPVCPKNLSSLPLKAFKLSHGQYHQASGSSLQQLYFQNCVLQCQGDICA